MITALDSSVLIDVLQPRPPHGPASAAALRTCVRQGGLVASEVVWSEVCGAFPAPEMLRERLHRLGVTFLPIDEVAATIAGVAWSSYLRRGGRRERMLADFLVAAHAMVHADRLLTRDRGYYRRYFKDLEVIDAAQPSGRAR